MPVARVLFAVHLAFVHSFVPMSRLLSRGSRAAHRCDGRRQSIVNTLTRQVEDDFIRHGFRGLACAPKCPSVQLAVATASRVESDSAAKTALNVIAETKAFLYVNVVVECPNGEEVVTIARLDTAANTDVVAPKLANVLKSNKVQWPTKGGAFVEVCGASSVRPTGFLTVPIAVNSRQLGLPRRLHLNIDACIMDIPG